MLIKQGVRRIRSCPLLCQRGHPSTQVNSIAKMSMTPRRNIRVPDDFLHPVGATKSARQKENPEAGALEAPVPRLILSGLLV